MEEKKNFEASIWDTVTITYEGETKPEVITLVESLPRLLVEGYITVNSYFGKLIYGTKIGDTILNDRQGKFKIVDIKKPTSDELKALKDEIKESRSPSSVYKKSNIIDD
jgi:transcription elongation GreA/GreB family factor